MRGRRRAAFAVAGGLALAAAAATAGAERVQMNQLVMIVDGGFAPKALPRAEPAPISLNMSFDMSTTDGSFPPALQSAIVDFDRNGMLNSRGAPRCDPASLVETVTQAAMARCRRALVGTGTVGAVVQRPGEPRMSARAPFWPSTGPRRGTGPG